jgi:PmbA protein
MAGNFFNLLKQVEAVGSDLFLSIQGIGSPSIKIIKIAISGE